MRESIKFKRLSQKESAAATDKARTTIALPRKLFNCRQILLGAACLVGIVVLCYFWSPIQAYKKYS